MQHVAALLVALMLASGLRSQDTLLVVPRDTLVFQVGDPSVSIALAKQQKKRVLIDFWADWCLPCKQMDRITFADSTVMAHLRRNYVLHRVDVSQFVGMDEAEKRKVDRYPTLIVLDKKGLEAGRMLGFQSTDSLLIKLKIMEAVPPKKGKR